MAYEVTSVASITPDFHLLCYLIQCQIESSDYLTVRREVTDDGVQNTRRDDSTTNGKGRVAGLTVLNQSRVEEIASIIHNEAYGNSTACKATERYNRTEQNVSSKESQIVAEGIFAEFLE